MWCVPGCRKKDDDDDLIEIGGEEEKGDMFDDNAMAIALQKTKTSSKNVQSSPAALGTKNGPKEIEFDDRFEVLVALLGNPFVGKASLVKKVITGGFEIGKPARHVQLIAGDSPNQIFESRELRIIEESNIHRPLFSHGVVPIPVFCSNDHAGLSASINIQESMNQQNSSMLANVVRKTPINSTNTGSLSVQYHHNLDISRPPLRSTISQLGGSQPGGQPIGGADTSYHATASSLAGGSSDTTETGDATVNLNCWIFSGEHSKTDKTREVLYRIATQHDTVILLCFDICNRKSFDSISKWWLPLIEGTSGQHSWPEDDIPIAKPKNTTKNTNTLMSAGSTMVSSRTTNPNSLLSPNTGLVGGVSAGVGGNKKPKLRGGSKKQPPPLLKEDSLDSLDKVLAPGHKSAVHGKQVSMVLGYPSSQGEELEARYSRIDSAGQPYNGAGNQYRSMGNPPANLHNSMGNPHASMGPGGTVQLNRTDSTGKRSNVAFSHLDPNPIGPGVLLKVLIGFKADMRDRREVRKSEAETLAENHDLTYIEVSTRSGIGISELLSLIMDAKLDIINGKSQSTYTTGGGSGIPSNIIPNRTFNSMGNPLVSVRETPSPAPRPSGGKKKQKER